MRTIMYLPDRTSVTFNDLAQDTTISEILRLAGVSHLDIVVFTGKPSERESQTPITKMNLTLLDYNMWFDEPNHEAYFSVFNKEDTENYNLERYNMYTNIW